MRIAIYISMGAEKIINGIIGPEGGRLDKALASASGLSREKIKTLIEQGRISLNGLPARSPAAKVAANTGFTIKMSPPRPLANPAQPIALTIIYEDDDIIVVDKPAGMVVHPAAGNPDGTLVNALLHHCEGRLSNIAGGNIGEDANSEAKNRPGIVHRLDKDTSGLLVAAKTNSAHEGLARQFADHTITRAYLAVVNGKPQPPSGCIRSRIGRSATNRKKMAVLDDTSLRGKLAITHYQMLRPLGPDALIECRLETGRTHQIRVHMSSIGHGLVGDPIYGRSPPRLRPLLNRLGFRRQALHAARLGFIHPQTEEKLDFSSMLPADMQELIENMDQSDR